MKPLSVEPTERAVAMRKITWRLVPFLMLCYFISYIDRINIGFAALQMRGELNLSATAYGLGGSLFLVSYCLFSVPSNAGLQRFGTRQWIALLMIVWGALSMAMSMVTGPISFYVLRFLVGAAEAGFFPGIVFYITRWFPASYRARIASIFLLAVPLSSFVGSTLSGALMEMHGGGLRGWQWLFLIEGAPSVLLGFGFLWLMADGPKDARWLSAGQKQALIDELEAEEKSKPAGASMPLIKVLFDRQVMALSLTYSGVLSVGVCLSLWQPQLIKAFGPNPKPAPDVYLAAARRLRVAPERCIVVEDSVTGASAAVAAGMTVLGFAGGAHAPEEQAEKLRNVGANAVFYSMRELPLLVESWTQDQLAATSVGE